MENSKQTNHVTFPKALGLLFIYLKLTNNIDWNWWFVLSPFWIGAILSIVVYIGEKAEKS